MLTPRTAPRHLLQSVQVLRALGMAFVLLGHIAIAVIFGDQSLTQHFSQSLITTLANTSDGMLDFFFVGSGFIMVYITRDAFGSVRNARNFFLMRLSRVAPVYWIYTSLAIGMGALIGNLGGFQEPHWETALKSYLFIPYSSGTMRGIFGNYENWVRPALPAGWTLNYEMYLYALFALAMIVRMEVGLALMSAWLVIAGVLHPFIPQSMVAVYFWTSTITFKFAMGAWVGYAYWRGVKWDGPGWAAMGIAIAGFLGHWALYSVFLERPDTVLFHGLAGVMAAIVIGAAVLTKLEHTQNAPRLLVEMGDASYSTYLCHIFVYVSAFGLCELFFDMTVMQRVILGVFCFVMSLVAGHFSYKKIELPLIAFFRRFLKARNLV